MPAYSFEALDPQGQTRRGVLEADTARTARSQLRAQDLVPLKVEPVQRTSSGLNTVIWESRVSTTQNVRCGHANCLAWSAQACPSSAPWPP